MMVTWGKELGNWGMGVRRNYFTMYLLNHGHVLSIQNLKKIPEEEKSHARWGPKVIRTQSTHTFHDVFNPSLPLTALTNSTFGPQLVSLKTQGLQQNQENNC